MVRTDLATVLSDVLTLRGVVAVALVDGGGSVRESAAQPGAPGFAGAGPLLSSALAASRVIGDFVGGELRQTVLEYQEGPVVLAAVPAVAGTEAEGASADGGTTVAGARGDDAEDGAGMVLALRLESLADLGRVRFHLPRVLQRVAAAV